jgi:hypothetical protein
MFTTGINMNDPVAVIDAFDKWWTTRPEPHISSPKQSHMKMQQDRMLAIWLSAWDAAKAHSAINETKKKVE